MLDMVKSIKKLMFPNGLWLCVDFNLFDRSIKARLLSFTMIYFFRVVSGLKTKELLDYFGAIKQVGGETITHQYFYNKFIKAELFRVK